MKNNPLKSNWFRFLVKISSVLSVIAVIAAMPMCGGEYYQPVVPKSLQHNE